jgi:hypothetical protein
MKDRVYTDLEKEHIHIKHEALRMETIEFLVKKYTDDKELGEKIRKFVKLKSDD